MKILDVDIEIPDGPLGIKLSGGADSSLLLYILMSNTTYPIHIFSGAYTVNQRSHGRHAFQVIDKCIELTGNTNVFQHILFSSEIDHEPLNDFALGYAADKKIKFIYTGLTSNPDIDVYSTFKNYSPDWIDDRAAVLTKELWFKNNTIYKPFNRINKQKIKEMYEYLGILESLFPLTRSCVSTKVLDEHCGECWWCEERLWAFGRYK